MDIKRAKEIVQTGFAWAGWTPEQADAFRTLLIALEQAEILTTQLKQENNSLRGRIES